MKKIRVGILGYGRLGKSIEQLVSQDENFKLVAIINKRVVTSKLAKV